MGLSFFWIPVRLPGPPQDELNQFLRRKRVLSVQKQLCVTPGDEGWTVVVEFTDESAVTPVVGKDAGSSRIDYREILPPEVFARFAAMRTVRKALAAEDGVPPFQVATNEQLAEIARLECRDLSALADIVGFGPARAGKYGDRLIAAMHSANVEKAKPVVAAPSAGGKS